MAKPTKVSTSMPISNVSEAATNIIQTISYAALILGSVLALAGTIGAFWSQGLLSRYASAGQSENELKIEEAKRDAAKANEGLANANERAAALEKEAATARLELEKLKERQAPRVILAAQEAAILSKLKDLSSVHICFEIDTGSDDALSFANSIGRVLRRAGYMPLPMCRAMTGNVSRDITISPTDAPETLRIVAAFTHAGLRATNIPSGSHMYLPGYTQQEPPDTITLTIGRRGEE